MLKFQLFKKLSTIYANEKIKTSRSTNSPKNFRDIFVKNKCSTTSLWYCRKNLVISNYKTIIYTVKNHYN